MKICILSGNPKKDGLCQSVINSAREGAMEGNAEVDEIRLCEYKLLRCQVCGNGWGPCRDQNICTFGNDGFDDILARIKACDALVLATPVYWGETSELLKCFLDRLRRCEFSGEDLLRNKQALMIASAGGSGNGVLTCLEQMDRFCRQSGMVIFDYMVINRWNNDYKKQAVWSAAKAMAEGRQNGETV